MNLRAEETKALIGEGLQCLSKQRTIGESVGEDFGLAITPQQVEAYLAGKVSSPEHGWANNPLDLKAVRVDLLGRMAARAESDGHLELAARLLEQVAKECNDA